MADSIGTLLLRDTPTLREADPVDYAARTLLDSELPALPVVDERDRFVGIFGETECIAAAFPGYLSQLDNVDFVSQALDQAWRCKRGCGTEPVARHMSRDPVSVTAAFTDLQIAETFLHHDTPIVPVVDREKLRGIVTRKEFFRAVATQRRTGTSGQLSSEGGGAEA